LGADVLRRPDYIPETEPIFPTVIWLRFGCACC